jgi:sulfopyruvate decarboxylase TPP-binding subunit
LQEDYFVKADLIVSELKKCGITHVIGVPDNGSRAVYELLWKTPGMTVILTCREGEAFGVAAGLYVGGKMPLLLIQNTGFLESGDALRGTGVAMSLPLLMIIGYRGYATLNSNNPARVDTAASFLEPTLKAWEIPFYLMKDDAAVANISKAFGQAQSESRPVAVLLVGEAS